MSATFTSSGVAIQVDEYLATTEGRDPAVILLHGADGMALTPWSYRSIGNWFASRGHNCYVVHYFDSTGTVLATPLITSRSFGTWVQVVTDARKWVEAQLESDPDKIAIMGMSLGASLAISAANIDPWVKALAAWYGAEATWYQTAAVQPITHLPPTIIIHGQDDPISPIENAYALEDLLDSMSVPCEMYTYPDQGHVLNPANQEIALGQTLAFFQKHL